jgi:hypothetical protein
MKGFVVIAIAQADPASVRHYVAAEDEAKAIQLTASHPWCGIQSAVHSPPDLAQT